MKALIGLVLVLAGAVLLTIGVFMPLVSAPYVGAVTFVTSGDSPRVVMFAMGIGALVLGLAGQARHAIWPGLLALAAIGYGFFTIQRKIGDLDGRFGDNVIGRLVNKATDSIHYEGGWIILLMGGVLVVIGAGLAWLAPPRRLPPAANRVMVSAGAVLAVAGIFLPLVQVPRIGVEADILGSVWPRVVLGVAALAAFVVMLPGWTRHALWPGLAGLAALVVAYVQVLSNVQAVQARIEGLDDRLGDGWLGKAGRKGLELIEKRYGDEWIGKAADKATELIQLQWGWAVMTIGLVLIIMAAARAWRASGGVSGDLSQLPRSEPRQ